MNGRGVHIAFLITRSDAIGGASIHVRDMASALARQGACVTVLLGGDKRGEVVREMERHQINCRMVPLLDRRVSVLKDAGALIQMVRALREIKPDLVSTHTAKAGFLGRAACSLIGIPVLYTPHGWAITNRISASGGRFFRMAERLSASWAASIVNVCEAERRLALRNRIAPPEKLTVIHNGVVDIAPRLRAEPGLEPPKIVMVARFDSPKDHETLLRAAALLGERPWTLQFVGDGPQEDAAKQLAASLRLRERVQFSGSSANVAERLSQAQIFVLASRSEGFPRSILEAMRAGLPVVASDVGGTREAVLHGETGLVVPPSDPQVLAQALSLLLNKPALRERYGALGRKRYESKFTFDRMFADTLALYRSALGTTAEKVLIPTGDLYGDQPGAQRTPLANPALVALRVDHFAGRPAGAGFGPFVRGHRAADFSGAV